MKKAKVGLCLLALLTLTTFVLLFLTPTKVTYENINTVFASTNTSNSTSTTAKTFSEMPQVLLDISWCESRDDQNKIGYNYRKKTVTLADGSTTTQKFLWSKDIGRWQINEYFHKEKAASLGFDIYTEEGNALYAIVLYNSNGTRDWNASKPCWSNIEAWKAKEQSYY